MRRHIHPTYIQKTMAPQRNRCSLRSISDRCFCLDPDPVFKFLWIRIRFQPPYLGAKTECRKGVKSYLLEESLKITTKDRQKMKKATIFGSGLS